PVLQQKLEDRRHATPGSGQVGKSSLDVLAGTPVDLSATKDACAALGASLRGRKELPIFFAFGGVSASVSAIAELTVDAETVWDMTHQQEAVFVGREYAVTPGVNIGAGIYAGLGLIDVDRMTKHGEETPANVIEGWSGDYFGAALDLETPFKIAWAQASCVTDKAGNFFACALNGGVGLGVDLLPIHGDVMKGSVAPSTNGTKHIVPTWLPHAEPLPMGEFKDKKYPYIQFKPMSVGVIPNDRALAARSAISMLLSMPLPLAVASAPLALAAAVDQDLKRTHGTSLATACANAKR
ncbi:MAG TPA: hypothetical protein VLT33_40100, partial [Labilithrix sp.]|nr:hypothetical protein [Labilithrix sp.]